MAGPLPELEGRLGELGLASRPAAALARDLARLERPARDWALSLARVCGNRAAEALRSAADVLAGLELEPRHLAPLLEIPPDAALSLLRSLPVMRNHLGRRGLERWLDLVAEMEPGRLLTLAEAAPGILAGLPRRAGAGLVLRLGRALAPGGDILAGLDLAAQAARSRPRPRLLLALGLTLARVNPQAARLWLGNLDHSPARELGKRELKRWVERGLALGPEAASRYFAPDSPGGAAAADALDGGLSLLRLLPWLEPYASLHAGRRLRLVLEDRDPTLPHLDLDHPGVLSLPRRLGPEVERPRRLARALVVLAAGSRRLGIHQVESSQVGRLLQRQGLKPPGLQELTPPALFCSAFDSPGLAGSLLALVVETRVAREASRRLPGVARDLEELRRLRRRAHRYWPGLEPARRVFLLMVHALAGGGLPPQALLPDFQLARRLARKLREQVAGASAPELMALAAELYQGLLESRPAPRAQPAPAPPRTRAGPGMPGGESHPQEPALPPLPLSTMGPGPHQAPPPWNQDPKPGLPSQEPGFYYPEWDPRSGRLAPRRARVLPRPAPQAPAEEFLSGLARRAALARAVERAFMYLAPRQPQRLRRQSEGSQLDLAALVDEYAERAAGILPRGLVFRRRRPYLRRVCCGVLWDVSGSTRHQLNRGRGEKVAAAAREALALFARALEAADDEYALWAFSGMGASRVDFFQIKDFDEPLGPPVHRRLAGLGPRAQNRDGTAIRHATSLLANRAPRRRLLIIISDGRPDDYGYGPRVAEKDLPLALAEARSKGVRPVALLLVPPRRRPHPAYRQVPHLILPDLDSLARWLPALYRRLTG